MECGSVEAGDYELLNYDESSLLVQLSPLTPWKKINLVLPEDTVMASSDVQTVALLDTTYSFQAPP